MKCPKCGHEQAGTIECESCGIFFAKYQKYLDALARQQENTASSDESVPAPTKRRSSAGLILGGVVVIAVVAGSFFLGRSLNPPSSPDERAEQTSAPISVQPMAPTEHLAAFGDSAEKSSRSADTTEIIGLAIISKSNEKLIVEVEYSYDGKLVFDEYPEIRVEPVADVVYWPHESVLASPGRHKVSVVLGHPNWSNVPDVLAFDKVIVSITVSIYDRERKRNYSHKISSKTFPMNHSISRSAIQKKGG